MAIPKGRCAGMSATEKKAYTQGWKDRENERLSAETGKIVLRISRVLRSRSKLRGGRKLKRLVSALVLRRKGVVLFTA